MNDKVIKGKECRFAVYVAPPSYEQPDLHFVKELTHYTDGTTKPTINLLYDFQRPFWVVKKGMRNFKQPKEWIDKDFTNEYKSSQAKLIENAAKALGTPWFRGHMRLLHENPFLFGTDIKSTAIVKKAYMDKYPDLKTPFSVCMLDVETDVLYGTDEIIMMTIFYQNQCITAVTKKAVEGHYDVIKKVDGLMKKYLDDYIVQLKAIAVEKRKKNPDEPDLGEYLEKLNIQSETIVVDNEIDVIKTIFDKVHKLMPDFVSIWNLDFEVTKFIAACERACVDPADIFSDPNVPPQYRYFNYKRGPSQKVTASGLVTPIKPAMRWHTVQCPASFYFIDAMCTYRHTRMGKQEKQSYSLDAILKDELSLGKLTFTEADAYTKLKWHQFMQENYMLEYLIYNRFDCITMHLLEEKVKDVSVVMVQFSGTSDFEDFKSQPRRAVDQLHWFVADRGKVMGTTSNELVDEFADDTLGTEEWIVALPAPLITQEGLNLLQEDPNHRTNIYGSVGD